MRQTCITCGVEKSAEGFWRQAKKASGLFAECKACARERNARWHRENAAIRTPRIVANVNAQRRRNPMATILAGARHRARLHGLSCTITLADVKAPEFCPVLGIRLESGLGKGRPRRDWDAAPSIDRIDNAKGYTPDNVIVVSFRANRIKSNATVDELEAVATFYRRLEHERRAQGAGGRVDAEVGRLPPAMSPMLAHPQKEEGPMPARHHDNDNDQGLLPSLRLGRGVR